MTSISLRLRYLMLLLLLACGLAQAARLKEIAEFKGAEGADLIGLWNRRRSGWHWRW